MGLAVEYFFKTIKGDALHEKVLRNALGRISNGRKTTLYDWQKIRIIPSKQKLILTIRMLLCFYLKSIIMTQETILISERNRELFLCLLFINSLTT